jgi:hypothetical protein
VVKVEEERWPYSLLSCLSPKRLIVSPTYGKNNITTSELTTRLSYDYKRTRSVGAGASEGLGLTIRNNHIIKYANSMRKGTKGPQYFHCK